MVYAGMDDEAARLALQNHQRHEGKAIAAWGGGGERRWNVSPRTIEGC